jgi:Type II secretion system (T2SS), protein G
MKAEGRRQKAKVWTRCARRTFHCFYLLPFAFLLLPSTAQGQKRPKPALKTSEARLVIAATPGFKLKKSAVKIKEISAAGQESVTVVADVTEAVRFASVEDERAPQNGGVFKQTRWRAVEFRTGDRSWEGFDFLGSSPLIEFARRALEEIVTEFEARQAEFNAKKEAAKDKEEAAGAADQGDAKGKKKKRKEKAAKVEPLTRGPLTVKQLDTLLSSAVAELTVEATFRLTKDESGKWRVADVSIGDASAGDLTALWRAADEQKAARARQDLEALSAALEAFRRERGFYVVATDSAALMDHLSPRYIKQVIRLDPWHNPYRYTGTTAGFTLASDGADGKPGTSDDVTISR